MRWAIGLWASLTVSAGGSQSAAQAPAPDLAPVAEAARTAFLNHRFEQLLRGGESIRLRLPGAEAGAPVRWQVAVASLEGYTRRDQDLEVSVHRAAEVAEGIGYVELRRRFRVRGVGSQDGEAQVQRVLLGVRYFNGGWRVVEVWVV